MMEISKILAALITIVSAALIRHRPRMLTLSTIGHT
jgi:hypothetical protein